MSYYFYNVNDYVNILSYDSAEQYPQDESVEASLCSEHLAIYHHQDQMHVFKEMNGDGLLNRERNVLMFDN